MAEKLNFNFKEKEGKYFSPIVGKAEKKTIVNGNIVTTMIPKSGVKGVYNRVRLSISPAQLTERKELFAVNTEIFESSR